MSDGREETNRATEELRPCGAGDAAEMFAVINDGALAYKGVIPADRWHEPYMGMEELKGEIAAGVAFWGYGENGRLLGVMGIQDKGEVALIRHAYVRTAERRRGIGGRLLVHLGKARAHRHLGRRLVGRGFLPPPRISRGLPGGKGPFAAPVLVHPGPAGGNVGGAGLGGVSFQSGMMGIESRWPGSIAGWPG